MGQIREFFYSQGFSTKLLLLVSLEIPWNEFDFFGIFEFKMITQVTGYLPYRMRHRLAIIKKSQIPISAKIRGKSSSLWGTTFISINWGRKSLGMVPLNRSWNNVERFWIDKTCS